MAQAQTQAQLQTVTSNGAGGEQAAGAQGGTGFIDRFEAFSRTRAFRQIMSLLGLAAIGAVIAGMLLWSQKPSMVPLYGELASADAAEVVQALQQTTIPFEIDQATGMVTVPRSHVHEARMKLAAQGLPNSNPLGFEMLQKDQRLGTSQFVQTKRYNHALEVELARSIGKLRPVEKSRVHLALPKQSVFVRDRANPTASVLVHLHPGRSLGDGQVASIVHLVSSSIPHMTAEDVTVVDQAGNLLSNQLSAEGLALNEKQFEYQRRVEDAYAQRIQRLLAPLVGKGKVQASVSTEIDFSQREQTQESFDPKNGAIRSEQISERTTTGNQQAGGVPGALTNQPPGEGTVQPPEEGQEGAPVPQNSSKEATRNYELDRTVTHTQGARGEVERLTVAVILDDRTSVGENGEVQRTPLTDEELQEMRALVEQAVGYDAERGDRITVTNASFVEQETTVEPPATPLWEQAWVWDLAKKGLIGLVILYLFFAYIRPMLKRLSGQDEPAPESSQALEGPGGQQGGLAEDRLSLSHQERDEEAEEILRLAEQPSYEQKLTELRKMVDKDPDRITAVVKNWTSDANG